MSSRISFVLYNSKGLEKSFDGDDFKIYKEGILQADIKIINNNDGTYYFPISVSAKYTVTVKLTNQDELKDIYLVSDDNLKQTDVDGATIEYSSGLKVKDNVFSPTGHAHDNDYMPLRIFDSRDFEVAVVKGASNTLTFVDRIALSDSILTETESLIQNIANLSSEVIALKQVVSGDTLVSYRQIGAYYNYANGAPGDTIADNKIVPTWTETSESYKHKISVPFIKRGGDTSVVVNVNVQVVSAATGYVQIKTGGGPIPALVTTKEFTDTDSTPYELTVDISDESNRSHEVQIHVKSSDVTKIVTCQLVTIEIK